ncbi:unnamed protein product [Rotaria sp. Silwood1]|nr:unnamed protein product [Rotaria sp. Silwood1]
MNIDQILSTNREYNRLNSNRRNSKYQQTSYKDQKKYLNKQKGKYSQKENILLDLSEKIPQYDLTNFINYSNIDKSNEVNRLIGRYDIKNQLYPTSIINKSVNNKSSYIYENKFEYTKEYSQYINNLLNQYINDYLYDNTKWKINCLTLCEEIKDFFKKLTKRYRIIVQFYIEQHIDQSIIIASRSLLDNKYDTFLQEYLFKKNIFILIIIFFIYKE